MPAASLPALDAPPPAPTPRPRCGCRRPRRRRRAPPRASRRSRSPRARARRPAARSSPPSVSAIRSSTRRPAPFRAPCTACTTSRASPSRRSSSSSSRSSATRVRARALHLVALERLEHQLNVVGADLVLVAVQVHAHLAARRAARAGSSAAMAAATWGMCLPKRGPERAVVGLQLEAAELVGLGHVAQRLHVQLVMHAAPRTPRSPALAVRRHHHGLAQRLAHLHLARARAPRGPAPPRRAPPACCHSSSSSRSPGSGKSQRCTDGSEPSRFS